VASRTDFNNPPDGHLRLKSEFLLERLGPDPRLRGPAQGNLQATQRASSLTRQLLAFSRKQMLTPKVLDLNEVVAENLKMLTRMIGEDIDLVMVPGAALGAVRADPGQIDQVIMNIAVNARDAMPQGGKLTIETANVTIDENFARTHAPLTAGNYVMLAISDTGVGMDNETIARFRALLHYQGLQGYRPRPLYGVRHREAERWLYLRRQPAAAR